MGGILLGSVVPGPPASISVEDYETIECDYSRGPLYRLSDADLGRFERAMEERSKAGKIQVVGFFRSHTRKGLALDAEDLQFLEARFRSAYSMALLVRPFATKASVGGIFLREGGGFNSEPSALEFPFRSAQLTPSRRVTEIAPPPTRAQVVPIATRREISVPPPPPPASLPPLESVEETVVEEPAPEPKASAPVIAPEKSAVAPPAVTETVQDPPAPPVTAPAAPAAKAPAAPVAEAAPVLEVEVPATKMAPTEIPAFAEPKPTSKVPMLTGLLAAGLLAFVLLFIYPGFLRHAQRASQGASQDTSPLTLSVEHNGTDLLLTWNRESEAVRNASRATLSITDGDRHENYNMDLAQLRTGRILYSPIGGDVSFQMEAIGKDGTHTVTETLRLLRTRPSPMPEESQAAGTDKTGTAPSSSDPRASAQVTKPNPEDEDVPAAPESKPASTPVKPFDTSSLARRLRPAQPTDLAEIPSPAAGGPVTPQVNAEGSLPFASVTAAPAAPPVARTNAPARTNGSSPAADGKSSTSGGQIQTALLIFRKEPEYPLLARQMGAKGVVELVATIGTDGSVKAVKVLKGPPLLVKAAQDAVMQWRYRPTLLNGVPIENDTRITLNFLAQK